MDLKELQKKISPVCLEASEASRHKWDSIAKPLKGLGYLEEMVTKIGGLTGDADVSLDKRCVLVMCADNGVVEEGVTQTDASVTALMAGNIRDHMSSVCLMAGHINVDAFAVDMGMNVRVEGVIDKHLGNGTNNMTNGPAMSPEQASKAIETGIELVREFKDKGYKIIATGEMGIGNTTSSSAMTACLLGLPVDLVTGRGAGLSDSGLKKKIDAIERAIRINKPDPSDPMDVLAKVGGFDIGAMAGLYIGGAIYRVPVVIDGLISSVAALTAKRLCPGCEAAMIPSHTSKEPAAEAVLKELGLYAPINAGLKLGEGTGAICMISLLDMALSVYKDSISFNNAGVEQYEDFSLKEEK